MNAKREPLLTDALFMLLGVLQIVVAIARLGNNIPHLPNDVRSQPWFDPLVSSIIVLFGLFFLGVGTFRLIAGLRERNRHR